MPGFPTESFGNDRRADAKCTVSIYLDKGMKTKTLIIIRVALIISVLWIGGTFLSRIPAGLENPAYPRVSALRPVSDAERSQGRPMAGTAVADIFESCDAFTRSMFLSTAYETYRLFNDIILPLAEEARDDGRPVWVVGNVTNGARLLSTMKHKLDEYGTYYKEAKVSSLHMRDNWNFMPEDIFTEDELETVKSHKPHIIILDTTTLSSDPPRALMGYENFCNKFLEDYLFLLWSNGELLGEHVREKGSMGLPTFDFRQEIGRPLDIKGPSMIFANGALTRYKCDEWFIGAISKRNTYLPGACDNSYMIDERIAKAESILRTADITTPLFQYFYEEIERLALTAGEPALAADDMAPDHSLRSGSGPAALRCLLMPVRRREGEFLRFFP